MKLIKLLSVLLLIFFINSCRFFEKKTPQNTTIGIDSTKTSQKINSAPSKLLNTEAKKAVENWKEYQKLKELMIEYYDVSVLEALQNSTELSNTTQKLKDSIKVEKLKVLSIRARLNVLHNEVLRLQDMSKITSITNKEVKDEVLKIVQLYDAFNSKINDIYRVGKYDMKDVK